MNLPAYMLKEAYLPLWRRGLSTAREVLNTLRTARGGGVITKVLAAGAVAGSVCELALATNDPDTLIARCGMLRYFCVEGDMIITLLNNSTVPHTTLTTDDNSTKVLVYRLPQCEIGVVQYARNAVLCTRPQDIARLPKATRPLFWRWLRVNLLEGNDQSGAPTDHTKLSIGPLAPPECYVSGPNDDAAELARRLRSTSGRTLLIRGPSGVGKTLLAQAVAQHLAPSAHILRISGRVLQQCSTEYLTALVNLADPTILLLDDVQQLHRGVGAQLLDILELLHAPGRTIILTYMTPAVPEKPGCYYIEGMRPGRVDEVVQLHAPDETTRSAILRYYYAKFDVHVDERTHQELLGGTDGLTGAYLKELAYRLSTCGVASYADELQRVWRAAPPL